MFNLLLNTNVLSYLYFKENFCENMTEIRTHGLSIVYIFKKEIIF